MSFPFHMATARTRTALKPEQLVIPLSLCEHSAVLDCMANSIGGFEQLYYRTRAFSIVTLQPVVLARTRAAFRSPVLTRRSQQGAGVFMEALRGEFEASLHSSTAE